MQVKNPLMHEIDISPNGSWHNIKLANLNIVWGKKMIKTFLLPQKNPQIDQQKERKSGSKKKHSLMFHI